MSTSILLQDARLAKKYLNGIICVYKPAGVWIDEVKRRIIAKLCDDLNNLYVRPTSERVVIEGATNKRMTVSMVQNLADDVMVVGPRYMNEDFRMNHATFLGENTSGVLLLGLNDGGSIARKLHEAHLTRAFKVTGEFGKATDSFFRTGRVMEKASYKHVNRSNIDKVLSHMQAMHQKKMYELSGVMMDSQAAYELAAMGPIRPANTKIPVIYGLKCVDLRMPEFTLEIQSISENEHYLMSIVHELGMQMKSVAHCRAVQCIRQGDFNVELALLRKHWQLQFVLKNIQDCANILSNNSKLIKPLAAALS